MDLSAQKNAHMLMRMTKVGWLALELRISFNAAFKTSVSFSLRKNKNC